jgi:uncharacterized protein (DUF433 family)
MQDLLVPNLDPQVEYITLDESMQLLYPHLTAEDVRRIIREELERARLDAMPKDRCPR